MDQLKENFLQVPTSALFRSGTKWAVFVEEKGKARQRVVEVSQRNGLTAEILAGLKENEKVVAYPEDSISDGTKIKARN
jgi:HlyD family secretion protein